MDTNTNPSVVEAPVVAAGKFNAGLPSIASLVAGVLLFLLPFIDIKCNDVSLKRVSGFELATGFTIDKKDNSSVLSNGESGGNKEKKDPNTYAIIALVLGVVSLGLSFTNSKAGVAVSLITAMGAAISLIGLMIDIKGQMKTNTHTNAPPGEDPFGISKMAENINVRVEFTPWYYLAVVAFILAAFFLFKRMGAKQGT